MQGEAPATWSSRFTCWLFQHSLGHSHCLDTELSVGAGFSSQSSISLAILRVYILVGLHHLDQVAQVGAGIAHEDCSKSSECLQADCNSCHRTNDRHFDLGHVLSRDHLVYLCAGSWAKHVEAILREEILRKCRITLLPAYLFPFVSTRTTVGITLGHLWGRHGTNTRFTMIHVFFDL